MSDHVAFNVNAEPWKATFRSEVKCTIGWAVDYREGRPGNVYLFINGVAVNNGAVICQAGRTKKAWLACSIHNGLTSVRLRHFGSESEYPTHVFDSIPSVTSISISK